MGAWGVVCARTREPLLLHAMHLGTLAALASPKTHGM